MTNDVGEKAMALVDGQLAPEEVPDLVQRLARSPALVAELQSYLATSAQRIAGPFRAKRSESVPPRLIDVVMRAQAAERRPAPAWRGLGAALGERLKESYRVPAWLLATGPALAAVAVALPMWFAMPAGASNGPIEAGLAAALERMASGKDAPLVALRPVLSFKSKEAWCRQYELRYAARQVSHGLACRDWQGRWDVVAATPPKANGLMPAGAGSRRQIDDLVTSMLAGGRALSGSEEAARISKGWSPL